MRYHIDTIPVWDAFRAESECPLCDLRAKNEQDYLDAFLGASVMEPDVRMEVNAKGFCARHFSQMFDRKNRLGLALMTHTHLKESLSSLCAPAPQRTGLFGRRTAPAPAASHRAGGNLRAVRAAGQHHESLPIYGAASVENGRGIRAKAGKLQRGLPSALPSPDRHGSGSP